MRICTTIAATAALLLASCVGLNNRQDYTVPAMEAAFIGIAILVDEALEDVEPAKAAKIREIVDGLTLALASGDLKGIGDANWHILEAYARKAIDKQLADGKIGPSLANLLRLKLDEFRRAYLKIVEAL